MIGIQKSCILRYFSASVQLQNGLIHGDHSFPAARSNSVVNLMVLILSDHTSDRIIRLHDLASRNHPPGKIGQELLGNDRLKNVRQLNPNLHLLRARKRIDDAAQWH